MSSPAFHAGRLVRVADLLRGLSKQNIEITSPQSTQSLQSPQSPHCHQFSVDRVWWQPLPGLVTPYRQRQAALPATVILRASVTAGLLAGTCETLSHCHTVTLSHWESLSDGV